MQKSKIEWCDYSINIIKGYCPNTCSYCYAHRMYNRFKWDKTIRYDVNELKKLKSIKEPSRIFVGSMIDMYHKDINVAWVRDIIEYSKDFPQHIFITLTKFPERLRYFWFPENWWVGVTIDEFSFKLVTLLLNRTINGKRFVSFEPLLEDMSRIGFMGMDWIIIGGLTPKNKHKDIWIDDIVSRADKLNIPVYIKDNANYKAVKKFYPK